MYLSLYDFYFSYHMKKLFTWVVLWTSLLTSSPTQSYGQFWIQDQIFETLSTDFLPKQESSHKMSFKNIEMKEVVNQQLSKITTDVIFSFCEEEMNIDFSPKEKNEIWKVLQEYFLQHPLCWFEWDSLCIFLNKSYADDMVIELLPYFFSKLAWYYKAGVRVFVWGNDKVWKKIQEDLNKKKLNEAKKTFIWDLGSAFFKLDSAVWKHFQWRKWVITIGQYFSSIMDVFPNPIFKNYISTLSNEQLASPISNISTLP